jgi:hypothetical protein
MIFDLDNDHILLQFRTVEKDFVQGCMFGSLYIVVPLLDKLASFGSSCIGHGEFELVFIFALIRTTLSPYLLEKTLRFCICVQGKPFGTRLDDIRQEY